MLQITESVPPTEISVITLMWWTFSVMDSGVVGKIISVFIQMVSVYTMCDWNIRLHSFCFTDDIHQFM